MAIKNPYQLAQLAYDAGFRKSGVELTTAVAAAIGESGGNTNAVGDGGASHGLWQIHLPSHPEYTAEQMHDAVANANAAYKIYVAAGRSFEPFHAWSHANAAKKAALYGPATLGVQAWIVSHPGAVLGQAIAPVTKGAAGAVNAATGGVAGSVAGAVGALEKLRAWVTTPANLGRLATGVVGAVVIIVGIAVLARPVLEPAAKAAGKAADVVL